MVEENSEDRKGAIDNIKDFAKAHYKEYLLLLAVYLAIALVLFWPSTLNITTTVPSGRVGVNAAGTGDVYLFLWDLWWLKYSLFVLHTSPYFTPLLYKPVGANLATQTLSPLAGLFSIPLQLVSLGFAYNVILFISFMLSGFFMYLLAEYLIKNRYAAFIAGLVFEFSPFHIAHALVGHLNWSGIEFIPLFILFFLLMLKDKKLYSIAGVSISFVLVLFVGDPEQGIISLLL